MAARLSMLKLGAERSQQHRAQSKGVCQTGLAAVMLPAIKRVGTIGAQVLLSPAWAHGGLLLRTHERANPPCEVKNPVCQRFDAKNVICSRIRADTKYSAQAPASRP